MGASSGRKAQAERGSSAEDPGCLLGGLLQDFILGAGKNTSKKPGQKANHMDKGLAAGSVNYRKL